MRVLQVKTRSGFHALINTMNVALVIPSSDVKECCLIFTADGGEPLIAEAKMDEIQHAWRFGSPTGNVGVFDVQV